MVGKKFMVHGRSPDVQSQTNMRQKRRDIRQQTADRGRQTADNSRWWVTERWWGPVMNGAREMQKPVGRSEVIENRVNGAPAMEC
jgi:hypothetical protein